MTAAPALERLFALERSERTGMRPGLERIRGLLDALGHPESALRVVHVAGTNGKGSVSALTESILRAAGLRTGLYTSPHLLDLTERIRIDGRPVTREALAGPASALADWLEAGRLSFFEAMTAAAFALFREAGVEAAVVEVGLGGRWDATNVGSPMVSVISRIDYDHEEVLGHRLAEIAGEKAAIVRGGVAISAAQAPEAMEVLEARCREVGVPLLVEGRELRVRILASDLAGHRLRLDGPGFRLDDLRLALPGLYQPGNAVLALGAAHALAARAGLALPETAVRAGCADVRWPGRFQVVPGAPGRPTVVLDGAHNPAGAAALAASLRHYFPGARLSLVLGISGDKDRAGMLKGLVPLASRLYLTRAGHPRATTPSDLAAALPPTDAETVLAERIEDALEGALGAQGADVVCVAGSLFLVADALRWLRARGLA